MDILLFILVGYGTFMVGTWGFAQIVGSIQSFRERGPILTCATILIWVVILAVCVLLVLKFLQKYTIALLLGYIISLIVILRSGKIE